MGQIDDLRNAWDGTYGLGMTDAFSKMTDIVVIGMNKAAADGMASTTTASTKPPYTNAFDFNLLIVSGKISADATLTAHDTNNAVISLERDDGANGAPAAALTWTTSTTAAGGTGNWAVDTPLNNTGRTATNCIMVPGSNLFFSIAKGGTGVVVPISQMFVRLRRIGG